VFDNRSQQRMPILERLNRSRGCAFVIGTGRSGTHWLGHTLEHHPEIRETIEVEPMFNLSKRMATNATLKEELMPKLLSAYLWQMVKSPNKIYIDKNHPNIWLVEELLDAFPAAQFLGILRSPYATISSMLEHKRVSRWPQQWREFPVPNPFLGITESTADSYEDLTPAQQSALRWKSHYERMQEIERQFPNSSLVLHYESLAHNTSEELTRIEQFLGLEAPITAPPIKTESLSKWKDNLTAADIESIEAIVGMTEEAYLQLAL
jgi:hypothetical protein